MRFLILLVSLSFIPSLAEAKVDFKCKSVNFSDQISGWIRFGYGDRGNSVVMEYWNGYPPIILVESDLDNGTEIEGNQMRYVSKVDTYNGAVATVDLEKGSSSLDKFIARTEIRLMNRETRKERVLKYDLSCIRH